MIDLREPPAPTTPSTPHWAPPPLPETRGPVTARLFDVLRRGTDRCPDLGDLPWSADPLDDDDLQLALYCCYELHYRGFDGVDADLEWDDGVLRFRRQMEGRFESALRGLRGSAYVVPDDPADELATIVAGGADGPSPSAHLATTGTLDQLREFAVHRSLYQLKEADAHTWAIPRYAGRSRSALVEIQMDEYGNGVPGEAHAELFASTMSALGLDPTYGRYVDHVGARTLATVNLVSWLGLHRRLLPALLGHLAVFEMTSVVPMGRYSEAAQRLGVDAAARRFYDVHVVADRHHGPLAARHLVGDFLADCPNERPLVMWGAHSVMAVERRLADHLMSSWESGVTSLRRPLPATVG